MGDNFLVENSLSFLFGENSIPRGTKYVDSITIRKILLLFYVRTNDRKVVLELFQTSIANSFVLEGQLITERRD